MKIWPEMRSLDMTKILGETYNKQKILEQKFEQNLIKNSSFNYGLAYLGGVNLRVLFRTILETGHIPQLEEVANREYMSMCLPPNNCNSIESGTGPQ